MTLSPSPWTIPCRVMPVFGGEGQRQSTLGTEEREGHLEDSTLILYVRAPEAPGRRQGNGERKPYSRSEWEAVWRLEN